MRNGNFLSELDQSDLATVLTRRNSERLSQTQRMGGAVSEFTDFHHYLDQQGLLETR